MCLVTCNGGSQVQEGLIGAVLSGVYLQPKRQQSGPGQRRKRESVLVLAGPTAVGKTELSLEIAEMVGGEIVSADSMQVYKGMNIGTAKASIAQQERVPHHMIDLFPVSHRPTVVDFYHEAKLATASVLARSRVPIVVGGSGFYLHTFMYGPPTGPASVPELRAALEKDMERLGEGQMYERVQELDPEYAETITPHDRQKIIRALEIMRLSGQTVSSFIWHQRNTPVDYDFHCWFLTRPRVVLYERIEERCDEMIEAGLLDEVELLLEQGLAENPSAANAIGYRQAIAYLQGERSPARFDEFVRDFKTASRRYAKRQVTWFRQEPLFRWIDVECHDWENVVDILVQDLQRR